MPVLFKGSGKAWPGFPISPAIRSAVADTRMKNALNQLARTEPEMLRSDLIFLLRAPCVSVLEPANKLSFLHSELDSGSWRPQHSLRHEESISVNRMSGSVQERLVSIVEQLSATSAANLLAGNLSVQVCAVCVDNLPFVCLLKSDYDCFLILTFYYFFVFALIVCIRGGSWRRALARVSEHGVGPFRNDLARRR